MSELWRAIGFTEKNLPALWSLDDVAWICFLCFLDGAFAGCCGADRLLLLRCLCGFESYVVNHRAYIFDKHRLGQKIGRR